MQQLETINLPHNLDEFTEIIDVRSSSEFTQDHLPEAINCPVLSDAERKEIGTLFKTSPFEARRLGAAYIAANSARLLNSHFSKKDKTYTPLVYCWRGGMRSNSLAHILRSVGWRARVLNGGYKAFRNFSVEDTEQKLSHPEFEFTVLAGPTGVAKTRLLKTLTEKGAQVLDLEGLAEHKGSILGLSPGDTQPTQKHFETRLWEKLVSFDPTRPVFTEAESNRIGKIHCPPPLWEKLGKGKIINIQLPLDQRTKFLLDDYPYFMQNPKLLKALLDRLVKLRGHEQIAAWKKLIDESSWGEFVSSILINHYDLSYRLAGDEKANYPAATHKVTLSDFSPSSLDMAADKLLAL